ncbi:NADP-dependent oxidoreductase domain-containing protein [Mariannaea sp. PMI_226]|nr:NADP-dependent oxidoreductase domain-containing protein [Mariannaea sp. PMI_226]
MRTLIGKAIGQNGLGLSRMTHHSDPQPDEQTFKVLKAAVEAGVTVWIGADFYGTPENNSLHLINRYFTAHPEDAEKVVICIKSGIVSMGTFTMDCSPDAMRKSVENANRILDGKKKLDIFGPARVDPNVPIEDTIKALAQLLEEGQIGGIQLSEVTAPTIRKAVSSASISMVECEVSLWTTDIFENGVAAVCDELKIPIVAHSPFSGGVLTGRINSLGDLPPQDHHRFFPRFQPDNFDKNMKLVKALSEFAETRGITMSQLALSWIRAQSQRPEVPLLIPVPGASSKDRLLQNCEDVGLDIDSLLEIQKILDQFPVFGERYPPPGMKLIQ